MTAHLNVQIVQLPPLRVACLNGYGPEPENLAFQKMIRFCDEKGLAQDGQAHRFFGYNNPNPSAGSPNYGYDVWVTVDGSIQNEGEVRVLDFPGGLYAVLRIQPITGEEIHQSWMELVAWRETTRYRPAHHQWLEEHIGDIHKSFPDLILDLYMPITE